MEIEYTKYRNIHGTFYRPTINLTFRYKSAIFPYEAAIIDTGSDFVMLPLEIAEALGAEPDLDRATKLDCACGDTFNSYISKYPIELVIDHKGFRPKQWQTHVQFVDAKVTTLLGHRGFLDRFDVTFFGQRHIMKIMEKR